MVLRQTPRAVTPWGGLSVFVEFLLISDRVKTSLATGVMAGLGCQLGKLYETAWKEIVGSEADVFTNWRSFFSVK